MTAEAWHVSPALLERYTNGSLDYAAEASVERHLTACEACRADVTRSALPSDLTALWSAIREDIAAPREPWLVRQLRRVGLNDADAVLLSASRSLHVPWVLAVVAALVFTAIASTTYTARAGLLYLVTAPLIPALGIMAAYDSTDPIREIVDTTPGSKIRLCLLRIAAVCAASLPASLLIGLGIPGIGGQAFAWLLPALALTLVSLVLLLWWGARTTATVVAVGWAAVVVAIEYRGAAVSAASQASFQVVSIVVAVAAAVVLIALSPTRVPGGHR